MSPSLTAGVLDPRGPVAANEYLLLQNATLIMLH
jgi:cytochrome o ubiquinol oxidase subunit 2